MRRTPAPYKTEAEMCAQFIADVREQRHLHSRGLPRLDRDWSWECYAECSGWDILLVRRADGFQIGIEAKLRLNAEVINQAIESRHQYLREESPDCRAVLVPAGSTGGLAPICGHIGLTVITISPPRGEYQGWSPPYSPHLPEIRPRFEHPSGSDWFELCPTRRHTLPEYVPDVAAGSPAPVQLTDWKIRAIKIAIILEQRGFVTRTDFKALGIDIRRWGVEQWLQLADDRNGWCRGPRCPDFRAQHPVVYEQIAADAAKWMPHAPLLKPLQPALNLIASGVRP